MKIMPIQILFGLLLGLGIVAMGCGGSGSVHRDDPGEIYANPHRLKEGSYKPDEVLVRFEERMSEAAIVSLQQAHGLVTIRVMRDLNLYQMKITDGTRVANMIEMLKSYRGVIYAEPNFISKIE